MQIARKARSLWVSTIMGRLRRRASEPSHLLRAVRLLILSRSNAKTGEAWTLPIFACSQPILVKTRSVCDLIRGSLGVNLQHVVSRKPRGGWHAADTLMGSMPVVVVRP